MLPIICFLYTTSSKYICYDFFIRTEYKWSFDVIVYKETTLFKIVLIVVVIVLINTYYFNLFSLQKTIEED